MNTKLSIVTINLNNAEGLRKTVKSVIDQTYSNIEYIVIDGGSVDGSLDYLLSVKDRLSCLRSERDNGIFHAMNKGLEYSNGEYCLFLNSGDWLSENSVIQRLMDKNIKDDIIYCNSYLYFSESNVKRLVYPNKLSMRYFYYGTLGHQATFIKRSLFTKYGPYNETFKIYGDFDLWLRFIIIENCTTNYMSLFLSYYDMHGVSSIKSRELEYERYKVLTRNLPKLVIDDYEYWNVLESDMTVLFWVRDTKLLFKIIIILYKIHKNIVKLLKLNKK